jgi:hypothetical protein
VEAEVEGFEQFVEVRERALQRTAWLGSGRGPGPDRARAVLAALGAAPHPLCLITPDNARMAVLRGWLVVSFVPRRPVRSADPLELLRRCAQGLGELGGPARLVLGVDDAHLLDPASAALVLELPGHWCL